MLTFASPDGAMDFIIDLTKPSGPLVLLKSETSSLTKAPPGTKPSVLLRADEVNNSSSDIVSSTETTCLYCSFPASKKCGKCRGVVFCGVEHQKLVSPGNVQVVPVHQ